MDDGYENGDVGPGVQQQADVQGLMAAFQLQAVQLANHRPIRYLTSPPTVSGSCQTSSGS